MNTKVVYDPYSQFERIELENGFQIYYLKVGRPWIKASILLSIGSKDDPSGKSGLAHFVEHLVFNNHDSMENEKIFDFFEENGGHVEAHTSIHKTQFDFSVPSNPSIFQNAIEIFSNLLLNDKIGNNFEKERNIINQEINERFPDNQMEFSYKKNKFVLQDTPLQNLKPILGFVEEFNNISLEDCVNFYLKNYKPQNMSIVLVGDMNSKIQSIISGSRFSSSGLNDKKFLINFQMNSLENKKYFSVNKKEFYFLQKTWKLNFILDFSVSRSVLYIHRLMLSKVLFSKFREELNINYDFDVRVEVMQGFYIYSVFFPVNSVDFTEIESSFEECLISLNNRSNIFLQAKNSLIQGILMADSSFSRILSHVVHELGVYGRIHTYNEEIAGYESVTFEELQEFNNFLISKSNRYIEIVK